MIPRTFTATGTDSTATVTISGVVELRWLHITYVCSADGGARQVKITLYDAQGNFLLDMHPRVTQIADETVHYEGMLGTPNETSKNSEHVAFAIPDALLGSGYTIVVTDENEVSATDTITINVGTND